MFVRAGVLSLVLPLFVNQAVGQSELQLDVSSKDSIKAAAKSLAGGIVSFYDDNLKKNHIPGLFPSPYYWWEAGIVWNALIGYSYLAGDTQYDSRISEALIHQLGDYEAFMPNNQTKNLGNDDQSSWALAAMTAAEVGLAKPKSAEWVDYAVNAWNTQALRWDAEERNGTCGGGLKWQIYPFNNGYNYKNSLSNGNFFLLSARLAKFTGNATYTQYAQKSFKWAQDIGLVSKDFSVFDGTDDKTKCKNINHIQWTATHGLYTEGVALMHNLTGAQNWTDAVKGFVNASSVFQSKSTNVLIEVACENNGKCDIDQRAFKGIFARTLARTALAAPIVAEPINKILTATAKAAVANACSGSNNPSCRLGWADRDSKWESATASEGNMGEVYGVLEVVQALLYPSAKGLKTGSGSGNGSASPSQSGGASGTSGASPSQQTGAAGTVAFNMIAILAVAFAAVLSC